MTFVRSPMCASSAMFREVPAAALLLMGVLIPSRDSFGAAAVGPCLASPVPAAVASPGANGPTVRDRSGSLAYLGETRLVDCDDRDRSQIMGFMLWSDDILLVTILTMDRVTEARVDRVLAGGRRPGATIRFLPFGVPIQDDLIDGAHSPVEIGKQYVVGLCRNGAPDALSPSGLIGEASKDSVHARWCRRAFGWREYLSMLDSAREVGTLEYLVSHADACVVGRAEITQVSGPGPRRPSVRSIPSKARITVDRVLGDHLGLVARRSGRLEAHFSSGSMRGWHPPPARGPADDRVLVFLTRGSSGWRIEDAPFAICGVRGDTAYAVSSGGGPFGGITRCFALDAVRAECAKRMTPPPEPKRTR